MGPVVHFVDFAPARVASWTTRTRGSKPTRNSTTSLYRVSCGPAATEDAGPDVPVGPAGPVGSTCWATIAGRGCLARMRRWRGAGRRRGGRLGFNGFRSTAAAPRVAVSVVEVPHVEVVAAWERWPLRRAGSYRSWRLRTRSGRRAGAGRSASSCAIRSGGPAHATSSRARSYTGPSISAALDAKRSLDTEGDQAGPAAPP